jgi:hypothetical protein
MHLLVHAYINEMHGSRRKEKKAVEKIKVLL